ncbi:hypothetical protein NM688_g7413 [Phlebia brevispora]|uniref:Uncharacterized protein n=1 Tax=Phlebia brevispora TaxID=194682 RepID=A0ACC1S5D5_9APHY|nr:hypothetical protein NM688_g7413 [Phlebia brevispora]
MEAEPGPIYRLPMDLLLNIIEYIHQEHRRSDLLALAHTSRMLNAQATPYLWRHLAPTSETGIRACLKVLTRSERLAGYVEELNVGEDITPDSWNHTWLCELLAEALPSMHRLTSLKMDWDYWYTTPTLLAALCAKPESPLEVLTLRLRVEDEDDLSCLQNLPLRKGALRTLRLYCDEAHPKSPGEPRRPWDVYYEAVTRLVASSVDSITDLRLSKYDVWARLAHLGYLLAGIAAFPALTSLSLNEETLDSFPCSAPQLRHLKVRFYTDTGHRPFRYVDKLVHLVSRFPTLKSLYILYEGRKDTVTPETLPALGPKLLAHMPNLKEISMQCAWIRGLNQHNLARKWNKAEMRVVLNGWSVHCKSLRHMWFQKVPWSLRDEGRLKLIFGPNVDHQDTMYPTIPLDEVFDIDSLETVEESPVSYITAARYKAGPQSPLIAIKTASFLPEYSKRTSRCSKRVQDTGIASPPECSTYDERTASLHFWMPFIPYSLARLLRSPVSRPCPHGVPSRHGCPVGGRLHRPSAPANVLLTREGCVKLIDFGIAWSPPRPPHVEEEDMWPEPLDAMCSHVCSGPYRAPETLFSPRTYDACAVDLWSAGATIAGLFTRLRFRSSSYDDEDDDEDDHTSSDADPAVPYEPYLVPQGATILSQRGEWERDALFDASRGTIGLAWSIFKVLGSPTDETWPSFHTLPDASKITFADASPIDLHTRLPNLPAAGQQAFDLITRLLVYEPARRIHATDALRHAWFRGSPLLLPPELQAVQDAKQEQGAGQEKGVLYELLKALRHVHYAFGVEYSGLTGKRGGCDFPSRNPYRLVREYQTLQSSIRSLDPFITGSSVRMASESRKAELTSTNETQEIRHEELYLADGDIVLSARSTEDRTTVFFRIDKVYLIRSSDVFKDIFSMPSKPRANGSYDGVLHVHMPDAAEDLARLLTVLYDFSSLRLNPRDPNLSLDVRGLLKLATKYQMTSVRNAIVRCLREAWPQTLAEWDYQRRIQHMTLELCRKQSDGQLQGKFFDEMFPEPASAILLALECGLPELLPAAFYALALVDVQREWGRVSADDLSRQVRSARWDLVDRESLLRVMRGKEKLLTLRQDGFKQSMPSARADRYVSLCASCERRYSKTSSFLDADHLWSCTALLDTVENCFDCSLGATGCEATNKRRQAFWDNLGAFFDIDTLVRRNM